MTSYWWRHHHFEKFELIFLLLLGHTTRLPSMVKFGNIFWQIMGRVNLPYPPRIGLSRRLRGIDSPFNPILGGSFSIFRLHMCKSRHETKLLIHYTPQVVSKWFPYIQWFTGLRVGYGGEGRDFIYGLMRWIWKTGIFPTSYLLIYWG